MPRPARPFHRRAAFLYLLAIVVPTLVLLYLGLQSVRRQAQAVASLTAANRRLSGERLAAELERRVEQSAQTCLDDSEIAGLVNPEIPFTPREARPLRAVLERIEGRHPVADQLFLVRGGTVIYPLVEAAEPRPVEEDLAREKPAASGSGAFAHGLCWTADGRFLLWSREQGGKRELWRVAVESGEAERLGLAMPGLSEVPVHPDGRRIAFAAGEFRAEIWAMERFLPPPEPPETVSQR